MDAISAALDYPHGLVTTFHLELCQSIVSTPLKFVLPRPNTTHVASFAAVAGPDNTRGEGVPGCYLLADLCFMD